MAELSKTMLECLKSCRGWGGTIHRHPGGYWGASAFKLYESFGTSTVEGLVKRGELEYVKWREGRSGRFPIAATIKATPATST
jgi:hypothetical protein